MFKKGQQAKTRKRSKIIFHMLKLVVYRKNRKGKPDFNQF